MKTSKQVNRQQTWEAVAVIAMFLFFCLCYKCCGDIQALKPAL